jgi:hypothetical protein
VGEPQNIATPRTARGGSHPPCRDIKIQSCCHLGSVSRWLANPEPCLLHAQVVATGGGPGTEGLLGKAVGISGQRGTYAEFAVAPAYMVNELPPGMNVADGCGHFVNPWTVVQIITYAKYAPCPLQHVRFCRYRFPATDLNSKATWFGIQ